MQIGLQVCAFAWPEAGAGRGEMGPRAAATGGRARRRPPERIIETAGD